MGLINPGSVKKSTSAEKFFRDNTTGKTDVPGKNAAPDFQQRAMCFSWNICVFFLELHGMIAHIILIQAQLSSIRENIVMDQISRDELQYYMKQYQVDHSVADLTPTLCALHGVEPPENCGAAEIAGVVDQAQHLTGGEVGKIRRSLVFCPDAVGEVHRKTFPEMLAQVEKLAGMRFLCSSVVPSVTPVCYASIFSGASPKIHGIHKYEKPILTIPTLFDAFSAAGKSVAIISVNGCSIDRIFRNRNVDYYSTRDDAIAHRITRRLIEEDEYDVIVSYYTSYDHMSHVSGWNSADSIKALATAVEYFKTLVADTERCWKKYPRAVIWTPDHGNHAIDEHTGNHGDNIPEDMLVNHFYRLRAAEE